VATAPTGKKPDVVLYDEATKRAFAADGESGDLTAIDAVSGAVAGTIALGGKPEFIAADGKGRLYVNLEDKAQIAVVDAAAMKVLAHYDLGPACESPTGLAMDQAGGRLFSVCGNKTMVVVDAATGKIVDTLPIGQRSDGAAFDPATGLAFSSNGEGTLSVVGAAEEGRYKVLQTVPTKATARTMALDPTTHNVYLAAVETEGFEPATAERPEPRPHIKPDTFMILTVSPAL
jgi:DNA-binding beta-propeller fold protein YncE